MICMKGAYREVHTAECHQLAFWSIDNHKLIMHGQSSRMSVAVKDYIVLKHLLFNPQWDPAVRIMSQYFNQDTLFGLAQWTRNGPLRVLL